MDLPALSGLITESLKGLMPRRILLGYSGGMDSELLAFALADFARNRPDVNCLLVHVHHNLSPNADAWAAHCIERAAIYELPLIVEQVQVRQGPRLSLEAEAREARYQALMSHLGVGDVLMTAHHQDDQLETVLLALSRGLGPKGLSAMGLCQCIGETAWLVRPFLELSREIIEAAVAELRLDHIEDESNKDCRFDRNFLRQEIIPRLKGRWGAIAATASRSARLCAESQRMLDEEADIRLEGLISLCPLSGAWRLKLPPLADFSSAWRAQLLRRFLARAELAPPSQVQLDELLTQLFSARNDSAVCLRFGVTLLRRYRGMLYAERAIETEEPEGRTVTLDELKQGVATALGSLVLEEAVPLTHDFANDRNFIALAALSGELALTYGLQGSTRAEPADRGRGRELKKLWQEFEVPPWLRGRVPMLLCDGQLLAAVGVWVEKCAIPSTGEPRVTLRLSLS